MNNPAHAADPDGPAYSVIVYEYPFNERIRAYLRLEYLFDRLFFFAREGDFRQHQVAVTALFDLLDACERTDIKGALLQDLERQRLALGALRDHPAWPRTRSKACCAKWRRSRKRCRRLARSASRCDEWLTSLRGRLSVAGGAIQVDMPSYYSWQHKPQAARCADLQAWTRPSFPCATA